MATRRVTVTFPDLKSFMTAHAQSLSMGALVVPPEEGRDELAPEVRLDLVLPLLGRVGPIKGQVVNRAPDGSAALRLPDLQGEAGKELGALVGLVDEAREWLLESGGLRLPEGQEDPRDARIAALEAEVLELQELLEEAEQFLAEEQELGAGAGPSPGRRRSRGFQVPDVRDLEPTIMGTLEDRSLRDAMVQLAVERVTGLLTVRRDDGVVRYGFWHKGGPVGWRTDPLQEGEVLGILLYKAKQITKAQLAESLELMEQTGQRQGEIFIEMNVMSYPQLIMVLGKQVEYILQRVMQQRQGSWTFHVLPSLPERFLPTPLPVPTLLYKALVQHLGRMPAEEVATRLKPRLDQYISITDDAGALLREMKFGKNEAKTLEVLTSSHWRMREFFSVSPLSRAKTTAFILALDDLGLLGFEDKEDNEQILERARSQIKRKRLQTNTASHFDVLEVHWICLPREIESAYKRLQQEYSPENFPPGLSVELLSDLDLIRERLTTSYQALKEDRPRRKYRAELIEEDIIVQSAELLGKKGEMAIMRGDRRDAAACFGKALELVPRNGDFRDGLQRAAALV